MKDKLQRYVDRECVILRVLALTDVMEMLVRGV